MTTERMVREVRFILSFKAVKSRNLWINAFHSVWRIFECYVGWPWNIGSMCSFASGSCYFNDYFIIVWAACKKSILVFLPWKSSAKLQGSQIREYVVIKESTHVRRSVSFSGILWEKRQFEFFPDAMPSTTFTFDFNNLSNQSAIFQSNFTSKLSWVVSF